MLKYLLFGEMAEWFKAPVLKTGVGQLTVGSNPSLSAEKRVPDNSSGALFFLLYDLTKIICFAIESECFARRGSKSSLPVHIPSRAGTVGLAAPPPALQIIFQLFRISDAHLIH